MMDPWRIAPEDRLRYEAQFVALGPAGGYITGQQARGHFLLSGLPSTELAKIWQLADYDADGRMSLVEFCAACYLIRRRLQGYPMPDTLPQSLLQLPQVAMPSSGVPPPTSLSGTPTFVSNSMTSALSSSSQQLSQASEDWSVPSNVRAKYKLRFNQEDRSRKGYLTGLEARSCLLQSGLNQTVLAQIWSLADIDRDGRLGPDEFVLAMYFVDLCMAGRQLPQTLPPDMLPPSFRQQQQQQQQQQQYQQQHHNQPARPASAAAAEPPPQRRISQDGADVFKLSSTLEEKRLENFRRGQAELEKRREALQEQMRAMEEARLAKERAEQERQEQARLAKERARQQELERQREAQRALEAEREAARRKAAEERERARMESERARLEAVEQQRAAAATHRLAQEQDLLAQAEQREANFRQELENLTEKGRECQLRAEKHRGEIESHKADIEAMRVRRDQLLADIAAKQADLETKRAAVEAIQRAKEELSLKLLQSDPLDEQRKTLEANIATKRKDMAEAKSKSTEAEKALNKQGEELANTRNKILRSRAEADKIRAEIAKVKARLQLEQQQLKRKQQQQQQQQQHKPALPEVPKSSVPKPDFPSNNLFETDNDFFSSTSSPWPPPSSATTSKPTSAAVDNDFGGADLNWGFAQQAQPELPVQQQKKPQGGVPSRSLDDEIEAEKSSQDRRNWEAFSAAFGGLKPGPAQATSNAASEPVYDDIKTSYRVLYDFQGSRHDEMSVRIGELLTVGAAEQTGVEASWLFARCGSQRYGLVPKNYVAEEGTAEAAAAAAIASSEPYDKLPSDILDHQPALPSAFPPGGYDETSSAFSKVTKLSSAYTAVATAEHHAASPSELNLTVGSEVSVSMRKDNWLFGRTIEGLSEGWFPADCVIEQTDYVNVPVFAPPSNQQPQQQQKVVVSLYRFDSGTPGDLNFGVAEEIVVTSDCLGDWWEGYLKRDPALRGIFPANFVTDQSAAAAADGSASVAAPAASVASSAAVNDPFGDASSSAAFADPFADSTASSASAAANAFDSAPSIFDQPQQQQQEIAIATAPFEAGGEGQLSLKIGTRILVKKKPASGWWNGEVVENGVKRVGWFPASYTKLEQSSQEASTSQNQQQRPSSRQSVHSNQSMPTATVSIASLAASKKTSTTDPSPAASAAVSASTPNLFAAANASSVGVAKKSATPTVIMQQQQQQLLASSTSDDALANSSKSVERVVAKYRYQARNDDELTFEKGTIITVISKDEPDWHRGRTPSLREGLFPVNYVEPLPQQGPSRQMVVNELTNTENAYYNDLMEVWNKFHKPLSESGLLTHEQLDAIFLNWVDLMNCSYSLLMALKVRKEGGTDAIGDIMLQHLPQLTCYVRFCGRQSAATQLLTQRMNALPELAKLIRTCEQQTSSGKLMGLIQYFVKPMQRITRYPLLIEKLLKVTPESHSDRGSLQEALEEAKKLCLTVNESVRETENSGRLEWCQDHIICEGLSEKLVFNSQTNCLGQRRLVHWGTLVKHRGGKELVVFLFNDFLLLTAPTFNTQGRPFVFPSLALDGNSASSDASNSSEKQKYRMYKRPIILNDLMVVPEPDRDSGSEPPLLSFRVLPSDDWLFRCQSAQDRDRWKDRLAKTAKEYHTATEKLAIEKNHQRSRAFNRESVGRLLLTVEQGFNLKVGNLGGDNKSDPYAEVSLGSQRQCTEVLKSTLNPIWNHAMQFHIADPHEDVLSVTVYDRDFFSPNTFLGRAELRIADIAKDLANAKHGPITKRLRLAEVDTGDVQLKFDLQMHSTPPVS